MRARIPLREVLCALRPLDAGEKKSASRRAAEVKPSILARRALREAPASHILRLKPINGGSRGAAAIRLRLSCVNAGGAGPR